MTGANANSDREMVRGWDRAFRAMAAEPRRQIVCALLEAPPDRALALPDAANAPYVSEEAAELAVSLRHNHLPKLAERGYVQWEERPFVVRRGPNFEEVAVFFEALQAHAERIPERLKRGCRRLEAAQRERDRQATE